MQCSIYHPNLKVILDIYYYKKIRDLLFYDIKSDLASNFYSLNHTSCSSEMVPKGFVYSLINNEGPRSKTTSNALYPTKFTEYIHE